MSDDRSYNGYKPRPFVSKEDMIAHLSDPRYKGNPYERDIAYQEFVEACLVLSEDEHVGANGRELSQAMAQPAVAMYQDPLNTLGSMTDVYRDMSEARRDQSSLLYKDSPFERQRVAEKIGRSTPDYEPLSSKQFASLQVVGDGETGSEVGGGVGASGDPQGA